MTRRQWIPLVLAAAFVLPGAASAQPERVQMKTGAGKVAAARLTELTAKVEALDIAARRVTLKLDDGTVQTLVVSPDVKNLQQVKVGDTILTTYYESLTLSLEKAEAGVKELSEKVTDQQVGDGTDAGAMRTKEVTVVAKITAIDAKESAVTLVGPKGKTVELEVAPEVIARIKVGDLVRAAYTEAMAVTVEVTP